MITGNNVSVQIPIIEQVQYFIAHQPPILGLILAYAGICLFMFWITRCRGYFISFLAAWLYLVPFVVH
jgi:hypothetical protein